MSFNELCKVCKETYGRHFKTNEGEGGSIDGAGNVTECYGFSCEDGCPDCETIENKVTCVLCGKAFCDVH